MSYVIVALPQAGIPLPNTTEDAHHVTLAYLDVLDDGSGLTEDALVQVAREAAMSTNPFTATIGGRGWLGDDDAGVLFVESDEIQELHDKILDNPYIHLEDSFPHFVPHITVGYGDSVDINAIPVPEGILFDRIALWGEGDSKVEFPLAQLVDQSWSFLFEKDHTLPVVVVAAGNGNFDPTLHPRGADGRFIRKFGVVKYLKLGKWAYGKVVGIQDGDDGTPDITLSPTDLSGADLPGPNSVVKPKQVYEAPKVKAYLSPITGQKIGGQAGSNPGGLYELPVADGDGTEKVYVKTAKSKDHGRNEWLANLLYADAGAAVPDVYYNEQDNKIYSPIVEGKHDMSARLADKDKGWLDKVRANFVLDAWLANHDVFGMTKDNILTDVDGTPWRIDNGGALLFRAMGGPKQDFGDKVGELDTLKAKKTYIYGAGLTKDQELDGANRILAIWPDDIKDRVAQVGLPKSLADTLIARRAYIAQYYGLPLPESIQHPDVEEGFVGPLFDAGDIVKGRGKSRNWFPMSTAIAAVVLSTGDTVEFPDGTQKTYGVADNGDLLSTFEKANQVIEWQQTHPEIMVRQSKSATPSLGRPTDGESYHLSEFADIKWQRGDQISRDDGRKYDILWANHANGGVLVRPVVGEGEAPKLPFILNPQTEVEPFTVIRWDKPDPALEQAEVQTPDPDKISDSDWASLIEGLTQVQQAIDGVVPVEEETPGQAVKVAEQIKADLEEPLPPGNGTAPEVPVTVAKPGSKKQILGDGTEATPGDKVLSKFGGEYIYVKAKGPYAVVTDPNGADPNALLQKKASTLLQPGKTPVPVTEQGVPMSANGKIPQVGQLAEAKDGFSGKIVQISPDGKFVFILSDAGTKLRKSTGTVTVLSESEPTVTAGPVSTAPTISAVDMEIGDQIKAANAEGWMTVESVSASKVTFDDGTSVQKTNVAASAPSWEIKTEDSGPELPQEGEFYSTTALMSFIKAGDKVSDDGETWHTVEKSFGIFEVEGSPLILSSKVWMVDPAPASVEVPAPSSYTTNGMSYTGFEKLSIGDQITLPSGDVIQLLANPKDVTVAARVIGTDEVFPLHFSSFKNDQSYTITAGKIPSDLNELLPQIEEIWNNTWHKGIPNGLTQIYGLSMADKVGLFIKADAQGVPTAGQKWLHYDPVEDKFYDLTGKKALAWDQASQNWLPTDTPSEALSVDIDNGDPAEAESAVPQGFKGYIPQEGDTVIKTALSGTDFFFVKKAGHTVFARVKFDGTLSTAAVFNADEIDDALKDFDPIVQVWPVPGETPAAETPAAVDEFPYEYLSDDFKANLGPLPAGSTLWQYPGVGVGTIYLEDHNGDFFYVDPTGTVHNDWLDGASVANIKQSAKKVSAPTSSDDVFGGSPADGSDGLFLANHAINFTAEPGGEFLEFKNANDGDLDLYYKDPSGKWSYVFPAGNLSEGIGTTIDVITEEHATPGTEKTYIVPSTSEEPVAVAGPTFGGYAAQPGDAVVNVVDGQGASIYWVKKAGEDKWTYVEKDGVFSDITVDDTSIEWSLGHFNKPGVGTASVVYGMFGDVNVPPVEVGPAAPAPLQITDEMLAGAKNAGGTTLSSDQKAKLKALGSIPEGWSAIAAGSYNVWLKSSTGEIQYINEDGSTEHDSIYAIPDYDVVFSVPSSEAKPKVDVPEVPAPVVSGPPWDISDLPKGYTPVPGTKLRKTINSGEVNYFVSTNGGTLWSKIESYDGSVGAAIWDPPDFQASSYGYIPQGEDWDVPEAAATTTPATGGAVKLSKDQVQKIADEHGLSSYGVEKLEGLEIPEGASVYAKGSSVYLGKDDGYHYVYVDNDVDPTSIPSLSNLGGFKLVYSSAADSVSPGVIDKDAIKGKYGISDKGLSSLNLTEVPTGYSLYWDKDPGHTIWYLQDNNTGQLWMLDKSLGDSQQFLPGNADYNYPSSWMEKIDLGASGTPAAPVVNEPAPVSDVPLMLTPEVTNSAKTPDGSVITGSQASLMNALGVVPAGHNLYAGSGYTDLYVKEEATGKWSKVVSSGNLQPALSTPATAKLITFGVKPGPVPETTIPTPDDTYIITPDIAESAMLNGKQMHYSAISTLKNISEIPEGFTLESAGSYSIYLTKPNEDGVKEHYHLKSDGTTQKFSSWQQSNVQATFPVEFVLPPLPLKSLTFSGDNATVGGSAVLNTTAKKKLTALGKPATGTYAIVSNANVYTFNPVTGETWTVGNDGTLTPKSTKPSKALQAQGKVIYLHEGGQKPKVEAPPEQSPLAALDAEAEAKGVGFKPSDMKKIPVDSVIEIPDNTWGVVNGKLVHFEPGSYVSGGVLKGTNNTSYVATQVFLDPSLVTPDPVQSWVGKHKATPEQISAWGGALTKDGYIPAIGMHVKKGTMTGTVVGISKDKLKVTVLTADGQQTIRQTEGLSNDFSANYTAYAPKKPTIPAPKGMPLAVDTIDEALTKTLQDGKFRALMPGQPGIRDGRMFVYSAKTPSGKKVNRVAFVMTKQHRAKLRDLLENGPAAPVVAPVEEVVEKGDWASTIKQSQDAAVGDKIKMYVSSQPHPDGKPKWKVSQDAGEPTHEVLSTEPYAHPEGKTGVQLVKLKNIVTGEVIESHFHPNKSLKTSTWDPDKIKPKAPVYTPYAAPTPLKLSAAAQAAGWTLTNSQNDGIISAVKGGVFDPELDVEPGQPVPTNKAAYSGGSSGTAAWNTGGLRMVSPDGVVIEITGLNDDNNSWRGNVVVTLPEGADAARLNTALDELGLAHQPLTQSQAKANMLPMLRSMVSIDIKDVDTTKGMTDDELFAKFGKTIGLDDITWQDVLIAADESSGNTSYYWSDRVRAHIDSTMHHNVVYRAAKHGTADIIASTALYGTAGAIAKRITGMVHSPSGKGLGDSPGDDASYNAGNGGYFYANHVGPNSTISSVTGSTFGTKASNPESMIVISRGIAAMGRIQDFRAFMHDAFGGGSGVSTGDNSVANMMGDKKIKDYVPNGGLPVESTSLIATRSASQRDKAIKNLKDQGITEINGLPVEKFIVMLDDLDKMKVDDLPPVFIPANARPILDLPESYDDVEEPEPLKAAA